MSIGKIVGYSIFATAAAAVGTVVIAVGALAGVNWLNRKAWDSMFVTGDDESPENQNDKQTP